MVVVPLGAVCPLDPPFVRVEVGRSFGTGVLVGQVAEPFGFDLDDLEGRPLDLEGVTVIDQTASDSPRR